MDIEMMFPILWTILRGFSLITPLRKVENKKGMSGGGKLG